MGDRLSRRSLLAATALLLPRTSRAVADGLSYSVTPQPFGNIGLGFDGGLSLKTSPKNTSYVASAVHFDGSNHTGAVLTNSALASTDNAFLSFAMWVKFPVGTPGFDFCIPWVSDPVNNYNTAYQINSTGAVINFVYGVSSNVVTLNFNQNPSAAMAINTWLCIMGMSDTQHANGSKITRVFLADTELTASSIFDGGAAFNIATNGLPFTVGNDTIGDNGPTDMAEFRLWAGSFIDWSVLANRRQIIDGNGKPVDPASSTLATPTILMSGDHNAFKTNRGNGGAFTLSGTLTDAATHP